MEREIDCSIIVPVYNWAALTRRCIEQVLSRPPVGLEWELIIVDDGSDDGTQQVLAAFGTKIKVVRHRPNLGFAHACNDGAQAARGRHLVFLNNDTEPSPGWIEALVDYTERNAPAAVVGSKLLYPTGTVQHAGMAITQERFPRHIYAGFPGDHPAVCKSRRFQCVTAAATLVRAVVFEAAGGFDVAFHNAYEDVDLCLRLREMGHETHYCADSVVTHLETVTRDFGDYQRNHELYWERWADKVEPDDVRYYLDDGLLKLEYWDQFPLRLTVSPLLAEVVSPDDEQTAIEIATVRARQVFELLRENAHLRVRLLEETDRQHEPLRG